jgi:photosystem I subunit III
MIEPYRFLKKFWNLKLENFRKYQPFIKIQLKAQTKVFIMQRFFSLLLVFGLWMGISFSAAPAAWADLSFDTLTPCGQNPAFRQQIQSQVDGYEARIAKFAPGSAPVLYLESKIKAANERYEKYANSTLICGEDGLPHLITDGRLNHAGEFIIPGLAFLYIAGWIGWVGRAYVIAVRGLGYDKATSKEIIIDVPLAIKCMLSGFLWPLAAIKEFISGELVAPNSELTVSPR